jgi:hypothetical protein
MRLACKLEEGGGSADGDRWRPNGILRDVKRVVDGDGRAVRVAFSDVNGIREFVPEGVKSCHLMGDDVLMGDVHALEGVAQGGVLSSVVTLAKGGYVGLGGPLVVQRNITGEVFQLEVNCNPCTFSEKNTQAV